MRPSPSQSPLPPADAAHAAMAWNAAHPVTAAMWDAAERRPTDGSMTNGAANKGLAGRVGK